MYSVYLNFGITANHTTVIHFTTGVPHSTTNPNHMKKQILFVCVSLFSFLTVESVKAQFADAVLPQYGYNSIPVLSQTSGNDIHEVGGTSYEVAVFDNQGNDAIIGWKVGAAIGSTSLGSGNVVLFPDVCLVKNGSNQVFALVTYFDITTEEVKLITFQWLSGTQLFNVVSQTVVSPGLVENTLQIASDDDGAFAIVWDEQGGQIRMAFGAATGSSQPALLQGGQAFPLDAGVQPDVCVFRSSVTADRQVNVVYVNTVGIVAADAYDWSDLIAGNIIPAQLYRSPNPDLQFSYPKIACPPSAYGKKEDFTIVVEDTDNNSIWYIKGFNKNLGSTATVDQFIYNNGSNNNSPWNISTVPNTRPVAAYDHLYETIWVSWNVDNQFGLLNAPSANFGKFPVAISGSKRAGINPGASYLYVQTGSAFGNTVDAVSLSGHKSSKALFTFNDKFAGQSFSKSVPHTFNIPTLRNQTSNQNFNSWIDQIISATGSSSSEIEIFIYDITGRTVMNKRIALTDAIKTLNTFREVNTEGVYVLKSHTIDASNNYSGLITSMGRE